MEKPLVSPLILLAPNCLGSRAATVLFLQKRPLQRLLGTALLIHSLPLLAILLPPDILALVFHRV